MQLFFETFFTFFVIDSFFRMFKSVFLLTPLGRRRDLPALYITELIELLAKTKKRLSNNNRGRLDLMADILETSQGGVKKTCLMYRCNLSFRQLKHYSDFMLRKELLRIVADNANSDRGLLETTDKGKEFLKTYTCLKALVE
jgi:predicted transcriptional regulator